MTLDWTSLNLALAALQRAVTDAEEAEANPTLSASARLTMHAGVVQSFEFTYEQCWKAMQRVLTGELDVSEVEGWSRRELFRHAAKHRLIDDVERWLDLHRARQATSHTYDAVIAEEVFRIAVSFVADAEALCARLAARSQVQ